jgi:release factor glutamine methyltransferase
MMTNEQTAEGSRRKAEGGVSLTAFCLLLSALHQLKSIESPRLTAEVLLAHVLGLTRAQVLARPEQTVSPEVEIRYNALVARAAQGEPLAYLTGAREFHGLEFAVDARVLVPRPETEALVDRALELLAPLAAPNVLDVGAGSGCIAIVLAVKCLTALITALDVSKAALAVARANARRHRVSERITFLQSDLLSSIVHRPPSFHLICANLPYIPSAVARALPVSRHEPLLALDGGPDGLSLIQRLLADAPRVLAPGGSLLLEIDDSRGPQALALARAAFPQARIELHRDYAGLDRLIQIRTDRQGE